MEIPMSIKRNFAYNAALNLSRVVFPLVTAPYVSRVLEPDGVGLSNFANAYAGYFALFALLGIPTYGIREVAKVRGDRKALSDLVSELVSISFISTSAVTLAYVASVFLIGQLDANRAVFLISGFLLYLAPFRTDWFYCGLERFGYVALRTVAIRAASVACLFLFVRTKSDLAVYVALNVSGVAAGDVWNFAVLLRSGVRPRPVFKGLGRHMSPLLVLFASSVAISVYTILDTVMLGFMSDYRQVGFYNAAVHMSRAVLAVVTSFSAVAVPRMSRYCGSREYGRAGELAGKSLSLVSFLAMPMAAGMACVAPSFVPLFFGGAFVGSVAPLAVQSLLLVAVGLNNLLGMQILVPLGMDRAFLRSILAGAAANFALNALLIPRFGAVGASASSVVAESLIVLAMYLHVRRTPIRLGGIRPDLVKSFCGTFPFLPIYMAAGRLFGGWPLIFVFVACAGTAYVASQKMLGNSSLDLFLSAVRRRIGLS